MVLAVVHGGPHVDHRVARGAAVGHGVPDSGLHGWDQLPGDRSAFDLVDKLEPLAGLEWFEPNEGHPELAVSTGLLFVLALRRRGPGDRLPVGDPHLTCVDLHAKLALHLGQHVPDVGLAHTGEHCLAGLVVAGDGEHRVLVEYPMERIGQLVLVLAAAGRNRGGIDGGGKSDGGAGGPTGAGKGVTAESVIEFGHGPNVARWQRVNLDRLTAPHGDQVPEPLGVTGPTVGEAGVVADRTGQDAQVGDVAEVGVHRGLEYLDEGIGGRVRGDLILGTGHGDGGRCPVEG